MESVAHTLVECSGNPSSTHGSGRTSRDHLERARGSVALCLGANPREIIFTASGSEANNLAVRGVARGVGSGTLVTSNVEHPAVALPCAELEKEGFTIRLVPAGSSGVVDVDRFVDALGERVCLATLIHGQNETGILQPVREVGSACRRCGIAFHTDAAQSVGKLPIDLSRDPFDLLTIVGHKFYGPKGIGALYIREGTRLSPLFFGGGQERGLRPGTENVALAAGLATALELVVQEQEKECARIENLRDRFEAKLTESVEGVEVVGRGVERLPGTSCLLFEGVLGFELAAALDEKGIEISTGSACHCGSPEPSAVLLAMSVDPKRATGAVRVGFGRSNTERDVDRLVAEVTAACRGLRN